MVSVLALWGLTACLQQMMLCCSVVYYIVSL